MEPLQNARIGRWAGDCGRSNWPESANRGTDGLSSQLDSHNPHSLRAREAVPGNLFQGRPDGLTSNYARPTRTAFAHPGAWAGDTRVRATLFGDVENVTSSYVRPSRTAFAHPGALGRRHRTPGNPFGDVENVTSAVNQPLARAQPLGSRIRSVVELALL